jgi:hypothetical protein
MSFRPKGIVELRHGVYQPPPPLRLEAALLLLAAGVAVAAAVIGRLSIGMASLYLALIAVPLAVRLHAYRRHGPLGRPHVALIDGTLTLTPPDDPRAQVTVRLADLRQLIVYGLVGRRIYRIVRHDGSHVEATPLWGKHVEAAVIAFLQRTLPQTLTVAAPQTLFASSRGDGP